MTGEEGVKLPQADLFTATAEPLELKRCALMTSHEYVGLQEDTFMASSTVSGYLIWWPQNPKFIFLSCFYVRQVQFIFC
jgi:hypothetical protein